MRTILIALLLSAFAVQSHAATITISTRTAGQEWGSPQAVLIVPEAGEEQSFDISRKLAATCPEVQTERKVQSWVPQAPCLPSRTEGAAGKMVRDGELVRMNFSLLSHDLNLEVNTSAVEGIALDFRNVEPTGTLEIRVQTHL